MRLLPRALLAAALGAAVSLLVACGGSSLLSADQASQLTSQLDQVSSAAGSGNCAQAVNGANNVAVNVQNLPSSINQNLRTMLSNGAQTLTRYVERQCPARVTSTTTTSTTSSSSTPTTTSSSSSSSSDTSTSSSPTQTSSSSATTTSDTGSSSTTSNSGGVGLSNTTTGSGGAGAGGNGGNGQ